MDVYSTFLKSAKSEYYINKSRFIARAERVYSVEEAEKIIAEEKQLYPDATHHCSAYILDPQGNTARFNDDGEPQGTAGKPILEVMRRQNLTNCIIVVTRYFGGILLGAGGLIRAYAHSAVLAAEKSGICQMHKSAFLEFETGYTEIDKLKYMLSLPENSFIQCGDISYGEHIRFKLTVKARDISRAIELLDRYLSGRLKPKISEAGYMPWQTDIL